MTSGLVLTMLYLTWVFLSNIQSNIDGVDTFTFLGQTPLRTKKRPFRNELGVLEADFKRTEKSKGANGLEFFVQRLPE